MSGRADGDRPLPARQAYRLWAPRYHSETAVSALERRAVDEATPALAGRALLDAGCGTGRRLDRPDLAGARLIVGIDLVFDMIRAGARPRPAPAASAPAARATPATRETRATPAPPVLPAAARAAAALLAAADVRALPLRDGLFDVVWCRLVLGHVPAVGPAYAELGRVAADGARLVMTDFHPAAATAGHRRSFRDDADVVHSIEHHVHMADRHIEAAHRSGWRVHECVDLRVGPEIRSFYEAAGALDRYHEQLGMPLVLMLVFDR
jgi:malonyl-CoA O-methyltransferase